MLYRGLRSPEVSGRERERGGLRSPRARSSSPADFGWEDGSGVGLVVIVVNVVAVVVGLGVAAYLAVALIFPDRF